MRSGVVSLIKYGVNSVNCDGKIYPCSVKGSLKHKFGKIEVGDYVDFDETNLVIENVKERVSRLIRPSIVNVDQILLVFSLKEPDFSYYLAFKYLTYASFNNVKASIVLSKSDKSENKEIEEIKKIFNSLNIDVYVTSCKKLEGIDEIKDIFKDKITVLMGQSGVGKSSLLNAIDSNYSRDIGEYSVALGRGKHQTKETILLPYNNGYIADTPGFSSLELRLSKLQIAQSFPVFNVEHVNCRYSNCLHISEPDCAIKKLIEEGKIPLIAYQSYLKLLEEEK